jgi:hypothetical protein
MSDVKYTKTATFLFPFLEIPRDIFECNVKNAFGKLMFSNRFINAYLFDEDIKHYRENCIFLVIRNYRDVDFESFYTTMCAFPNYKDDYEKNNSLVMVFSVADHLLSDYHLILNGKYSEISKAGKTLILGNYFFTGKAFTIPLILNKAVALKDSWEERLSSPNSVANLYDQEVWPIINIEAEKICVDTLKQYSFLNEKLEPTGEFE